MANQPKILSVCNSKGGVGKSVVTSMIATAIAEQKDKKVLIIDCDSQATVYEFAEKEKALYPEYDPLVEVEALSPRRVNTFLKRFADDYDVIFIDIPRMTDKKADNPTVMLLYNCDGILVPVIGSDVDVLATQEFLAARCRISRFLPARACSNRRFNQPRASDASKLSIKSSAVNSRCETTR